MSLVRRFPTAKQFEEGDADFRCMVADAAAALAAAEAQRQRDVGATDADGDSAGVALNRRTIDQFFADARRDACVVVRARPILAGDGACYDVVADTPTAAACTVLAPSVSLKGVRSVEVYTHAVDATFRGRDDTAAIYDTAGRPMLRRALDGASGVVLAYGQTGSGKTYTTLGFVQRIAKDLDAMLFAAPPWGHRDGRRRGPRVGAAGVAGGARGDGRCCHRPARRCR